MLTFRKQSNKPILVHLLRKTGCILFLLLFARTLPGQSASLFDIEVAHVKVGNLITEKVKRDSLTFYVFKSEVDAWLIVKVRVSHLITCIYKGDKLLQADIRSVINKENYNSHVEWKKDHYEYDCSTYKYHKAGSTTDNIDFSVVRMYFDEPLQSGTIFAENYALFAPLQRLGHSAYRLDVEKNRNTFHFLDGVLQKVEMETPLFNYTIRKKK